MRSSRAFFVLTLAAALSMPVVAPSAAVAITRRPHVAAVCSARYVVQGKSVTVSASLTDARGHSVRRAKVTFVWPGVRRATAVTAYTDSKGTASSTRVVDQPYWRVAVVSATAVIGRSKRQAVVSFMPIPRLDSRHLVTVKLGAALPLSQGAWELGRGILRGFQLAVAQADASPTVQARGIRFSLLSTDDQGDPGIAVKVAARVAADPAVLGVVGHLNSGCSIPASLVYDRARVPMVSPTSTNPLLTQRGLHSVFRLCSSDAHQGPAGAEMAYDDLGKRRAYVVDDTTPFGELLADGFAARFEALGGTVVGRVKTSDKDTDFGGLIPVVAAQHPDAIYYGGIYWSGALFASQLKQGGVSATFIGGDGLYDPAFISMAGAARAEGTYATSPGHPSSHLPDGGVFASAFASAYPGVAMQDYDAYGYDAANVIIAATLRQAEAGGTQWLGSASNRKGLIEQIRSTDTTGATGKITFDSAGDPTRPVNAVYKVVGGKWAFQFMR